MKKGVIKIYAAVVLAFLVGGLVGYRISESMAEEAATWETYSNAEQKFSIDVPVDATVEPKTATAINGRKGGVVIKESEDKYSPQVTVSTYATRADLEKDHGGSTSDGFEDTMSDAGLTKTTATLNGSEANIYSGIHAVDGVGGTEYDYIGVEVIGPTYAYMIQFVYSGTDPMAEQVQTYLNSFKAE